MKPIGWSTKAPADCTGLQTPTKKFSFSPPPCFIFISLFIFSYDAESQCRETLNMILMSANRCFISVCCRDFVKGKKKIKYYNHLLLPLSLDCVFVVCVVSQSNVNIDYWSKMSQNAIISDYIRLHPQSQF